ncbi:PDR/VanB family oxidoreductase [Metapseudomonas resinovorans]|uniref:Carnitine monooxygenase reductase subunit n=1 Tax=Metapseudomonas resinovorans NBRC 106553 TaxID=1245471 RepID=S6ANB9_METRE|nr:PDR/VanB family oxidoreductase [Pseudomonas resinovorans]BAN50450.1 putative oxygenase electron transfer component [Pseudomonas resinovorans NBRC 106553]
MNNLQQIIAVRVAAVEQMTPQIKRFTLAACDGRPLPGFTGGSHVLVQMTQGERRFTNAYSLMSSPADTRHYQIGVRREENSKGGSAFLHEQVAVGSELRISLPSNLFALAPEAGHHVLVAGGIGITPFLSQLHDLRRLGASYELHYAFRAPEHGAFREELVAGHGPQCRFYIDSEGQRLDLDALLDGMAPDAHVYVCGPRPLIDALIERARAKGIEQARVHWEQFAATPAEGGAFTLVLGRSGRELQVEEGSSILQAIERSNAAQVECLCREGVCGTCETRILEGQAQHFDQYLTDEEKAAQQSLMICVSRAAAGSRLVLDL